MISAAIVEQDEVIFAPYMTIMELLLVDVVVQEVDDGFAFEGWQLDDGVDQRLTAIKRFSSRQRMGDHQ